MLISAWRLSALGSPQRTLRHATCVESHGDSPVRIRGSAAGLAFLEHVQIHLLYALVTCRSRRGNRPLRAVVWLERGLEGAISPFRGEIPVVLGESERKVAERAAATDETARTMGEKLHKSLRTIENQRRTRTRSSVSADATTFHACSTAMSRLTQRRRSSPRGGKTRHRAPRSCRTGRSSHSLARAR